MTYLRKRRGRIGEEIALAFLERQGFMLIEKNWSHRLGEIDLIVERDGEVRFVEVKLRKTDTYGYPEASITRKKLLNFSRAIEMWLKSRSVQPKSYQADAIAIQLLPGKPADIFWIENLLF